MKNSAIFTSGLGIFLLAGCASAPVALAPVGPNPTASAVASADGQLEVYSALHRCRDGNSYDFDPPWYQHTDYDVYDTQGKLVKHVFNSVAHYSQAPGVIPLAPGTYVVKARAEGYLSMDVPVVVESGRTTKLHLDADWSPPAKTPATRIVTVPGGYPVGWSALAVN